VLVGFRFLSQNAGLINDEHNPIYDERIGWRVRPNTAQHNPCTPLIKVTKLDKYSLAKHHI
jgi:hypothetical protein